MRSEGLGDEDGGRTVSAADYTDRCSFGNGESEKDCADECCKYAELRGSTEEKTLRICNKRGKVGHCTDSEEDKRRINTELNAEIEKVEKTAFVKYLFAVNNSAGFLNKEVHMENVCAGDVGEKHTERDRNKEQRLKLFDYRKIEQDSDNNVHYDGLPCHIVMIET